MQGILFLDDNNMVIGASGNTDAGETVTTSNTPTIGLSNTIFAGNATVNATINSTSLSLANSTVTYSFTAPAIDEQAADTYFLNANGSWLVPAGGGGGGSVNASARYTWTNTHIFTNTVTYGNSTVNSTINSTAYTGRANNTLFVGTVSAANVVSNAQLSGNLSSYQTTAGLSSNVAILTSNNTSFVGTVSAANVVSNAQLSSNLSLYSNTLLMTSNAATAYSNATSYTDTKIGTVNSAITSNSATAYSNATSYADTKAATAYSNATSYTDTKIGTANTAITGNASTAYSNAVIFANTVANSAYANAVSYIDGKISTANTSITGNAATAYSNAVANSANYTDVRSANAYSNAVYYVGNNYLPLTGGILTGVLTISANLSASFINAAGYSIGNTFKANSTVLIINNTPVTANSSNGTTGQYLTSNGSTGAPYWSSLPTPARQSFTGDGTTNTFTVAGGYVSNNLQVFVGGALMRNGIDADVSSGGNVVFTTAPANGQLIDVWGLSPQSAGGTTSTIVNQQFTANGSANSFTITSGYLPGAISVFLNGVKQISETDVIITSGNTVNFVVTPANNFIVDVFGYQTSVFGTLVIGNTSFTTANITTDSLTVTGNISGTLITTSQPYITANNSSYLGGTAAANFVANTSGALTQNSSGHFVVANTGTVVNSSGLFVNSNYISTIASNSSTFANSSVSNTFTIGTAAYFVANGNVGIGTSSPGYKLDLQGGRAVFSANSEAFSIGLRANTATNGVWLGSPSANAFQISSFGGESYLSITSAGQVKIPNQPSFSTYGGTNSTLTGTPLGLVFTSALTNVGSNYSTSTGRFTAPVAGTYLFSWTLTQQGSTTGPAAYLYKNGVASTAAAIAYAASYNNATMITYLTLAASDYVQVFAVAFNSQSPVLDMGYMQFSGHLVG